MYQILQKMLFHNFSKIIKSYVITFGDEDEFDHICNNEYLLSDVFDMAYCIAKQFELEHPKEVKTYHVSGKE